MVSTVRVWQSSFNSMFSITYGKTRTQLPCIVNTIAADDLGDTRSQVIGSHCIDLICFARSSATIVLTYLSLYIPFSASRKISLSHIKVNNVAIDRTEESSSSDYSHHALVNHGVTAGLADDQIGPLHDHDGHEERSMAGVLQHFTLGIGLKQ